MGGVGWEGGGVIKPLYPQGRFALNSKPMRGRKKKSNTPSPALPLTNYTFDFSLDCMANYRTKDDLEEFAFDILTFPWVGRGRNG